MSDGYDFGRGDLALWLDEVCEELGIEQTVDDPVLERLRDVAYEAALDVRTLGNQIVTKQADVARLIRERDKYRETVAGFVLLMRKMKG